MAAASNRPHAWWLAAALLGLLAGAALQMQQAALWPWQGYAALGAGAGLLTWAAARASHRAGVALAAVCAMCALVGLRAGAFAAQALDPALEGRDLRVVGLIHTMPQRGSQALRLRLAVQSVTLAGQSVRLPPYIDVAWYAQALRGEMGEVELQRQPADVRAGQRWEMTVRLKAPHGERNPHGFDYELWLWEQGVQATGYVRAGRNDAAPRLLQDTWRRPIERARQYVRDAIFERLAQPDDAPDDASAPPHDDARQRAAGVVAALVTGDQRAIDRADWDLFRATGVAHLMAISGLHITMFAWLAALAVGALWRRAPRACLAVAAPTAALVGGVLLACGYALFSGWGVPAQRTVIMLAVVALLRVLGLRWPWPLVWLLACAAVVLADPWALMQAGFWLSFVAVGVLFASSVVAQGTAAPRAGAFLLPRLAALVREQTVVTVALAPLTLLLFGQVSVVGLAANLLAIPWVTLVVTPLALAGVAAPWLWSAAALALAPLTAWLQWLAQPAWAVAWLPAAPLGVAVAAVLGGVLLVLRWPWPLRLLGLPLLLPALWWQPARPPAGQFDMLAADIGQGNAVLVRTAGHALLYDSGPRLSATSDAGQRVVAPLLRALGERLDLLVLSHRDSDHTGGAAAVLAAQPQAALTGSIDGEGGLLALRPATPCLAGQRWQWDGVAFDMLHPSADDLASARRANAVSCVLRIQAADGVAALLAGDIEQPQEQALIARGAPLAAQALLAPHHGSKTSSGAAFLDAVQPRITMVQAGYRNRFGHPAPAVAARYAERGIALVESSRCGAAVWQSAQPDVVRCEREHRPRYWQHRAP